MTDTHSFLVYAASFRPLDHWQNVLPGAHLFETGKRLPQAFEGALLWLCTDVSDWQTLARRWSDSGSRVVVLTRSPGMAEMNLALGCGARAYVPVLANSGVYSQVAASVQSGALWFPEDLLGALLKLVSSSLKQAADRAPDVDLSSLTVREEEVARRAATGETNRQIASGLSITERTVKEHMGSVFRKLGVRDRMQLMLRVQGHQTTGGSDDVR